MSFLHVCCSIKPHKRAVQPAGELHGQLVETLATVGCKLFFCLHYHILLLFVFEAPPDFHLLPRGLPQHRELGDRSLCHSTKTSFPTFEALGNQTPHRCSRVLPGASAGHTAAAGTKGRRGGSLWIQAWLVSPRTRLWLCLPSHSFSITPIVRVKAELCGFCDVPSS